MRGIRNEPTVEPVATDFWYAAGFIDGEGCITVRNSQVGRNTARGWQPSPFASLTVSQVNPQPLLWMQQRWGGSVRPLKRRSAERPNDRHAWEWVVVGQQAQALFEGVRDMLMCKQEACDNAMRLATLRKARGHHQGLTPEEIAVHQEIIATARSLNSGNRREWLELPGGVT